MSGAIIAQPYSFIEIGEHRYEARPNPALKNRDGTNKSVLDHVIVFGKETNGAYRTFSLLEKTSKLAMLVFSSMRAFFERMVVLFGTAAAALAITRLPEVTRNAYKAVSEWVTPRTSNNNKMKKIHDIADATATWGYASSLIVPNAAVQEAASVSSLVSDATDLAMAGQDLTLARHHLREAENREPENTAVHKMFSDTVRYKSLQIAKSGCSVITAVWGRVALTLGGPLLSPVTLVGISLVGTVSALSAHFFKETAQYELPNYN